MVELLIQDLVLLVQRSEEYTFFLTSHMRDAVAREAEAQQAAAAARASQLRRRLSGRLSGGQLDAAAAAAAAATTAAAAGAGSGGSSKDAGVLDPASAVLQQHLGQCEARLRSGVCVGGGGGWTWQGDSAWPVLRLKHTPKQAAHPRA
jgi:hypothetical protein